MLGRVHRISHTAQGGLNGKSGLRDEAQKAKFEALVSSEVLPAALISQLLVLPFVS
jgi:hypothetical protein